MAEKNSHLIGGIHAIRSALRHGVDQLLQVWVDNSRNDRRMRDLVNEIRESGMKIIASNKEELERLLPDVNHQGIIARVKVPSSQTEKQLFQMMDNLQEPALLLVLDGVTDPHNLGACLRSADAAAVHAVIAPKDRAAGLTPVACKVASGAAETVPYVQVTNLVRTLEKLKQEYNVWVVGTAGETDQSLYDTDLKGNLAIVMGAEGKGMRRLTRESCDMLVKLPMLGRVESLNVSVATGVCLYEAVRQRGNNL